MQLPMLPNPEKSGEPANTKIFLSSFEYFLFFDKHVEYSDQHMGSGHSILGKKDVKCMKTCTIISIFLLKRLINISFIHSFIHSFIAAVSIFTGMAFMFWSDCFREQSNGFYYKTFIA